MAVCALNEVKGMELMMGKIILDNQKIEKLINYYKDRLIVEKAGDKIGRTSMDVAYDLIKKLK